MKYKRAKKIWYGIFRGRHKAEYNFLNSLDFIKKYASKIRWAKSICEIGFGKGELLNYLFNRYKNKEYSGVDLDPEILYEYQNTIKNCNLEVRDTVKHFKRMEGTVDAVISHCHLMYFPEDIIDVTCQLISQKTNKYILIKEILTDFEYGDDDYKSYLKYGFGRDYSEMFEGFKLKEKEIEIVNDIEYQSYLFKRI